MILDDLQVWMILMILMIFFFFFFLLALLALTSELRGDLGESDDRTGYNAVGQWRSASNIYRLSL